MAIKVNYDDPISIDRYKDILNRDLTILEIHKEFDIKCKEFETSRICLYCHRLFPPGDMNVICLSCVYVVHNYHIINGEYTKYEEIKHKRIAISASLRRKIFIRDHWRCVLCNEGHEQNAVLSIDHIIPVCKGGTNNEDNLRTLCLACNIGKNTKDALTE
jgi:hypothetical protein